ncbi:MAG TPA: hybrid sensor histidine kinase/response regulator [Candidatus Sericytochromatia bacterium]
MAINSDIRDHAYQFFIEEAPDLLQVIEAGLLSLRQEKNTAKVHDLMRAAHSLKGGAASVELEAIATLAHRLETIFKALYSETLEIDTDLESQLLQAYDCLRLPLMEQITTGHFEAEPALALAEPIFAQIEAQLGDALTQTDNYLPSSSDLGIDMTKSIFEVDVTQGLEHLAAVVAYPQDYELVGELRAQAEVFAGFAELLNQPGLGAIAATTLAALDAHPNRALEIAQLALTDFQAVREAVLLGAVALTRPQDLQPAAALIALTNTTVPKTSDYTSTPLVESIVGTGSIVEDEYNLSSLEEIFGDTSLTFQMEMEELPISEVLEDTQTTDEDRELEETFTLPSEYIVADMATLRHWDVNEAAAKELVESASEDDTKTEALDLSVTNVDWVVDTTSMTEAVVIETPLLEEVFSSAVFTSEIEAVPHDPALPASELVTQDASQSSIIDTPKTLEAAVQSIEQIFDSLPPLKDISELISHSHNKNLLSLDTEANTVPPLTLDSSLVAEVSEQSIISNQRSTESSVLQSGERSATPALSVRVDSERLGRMNNLVGELSINRNGLSLQNEQLQGSVRELLNRFAKVQTLVGQLQSLSNQMLVGNSSSGSIASNPSLLSGPRGTVFVAGKTQIGDRETTDNRQQTTNNSHFDSLELDSYGVVHSRLQGLLEEMMQLEESVDDIVLFAKQSDQTLEQQRQMLTQLRDELMWARMLPLGEMFNRFPRMLRDLSTTHHKPVNLKLSGTSVLVDKAVLEKLYDPLLHLLRNAFDHGIESPQIRRQQGKPEQGQIEIRAYYQGNHTIIEVKDDGQGLNLERIRTLAIERGLLSAEQSATISNARLYELIFEPGFSTASQVSELSGRGVGLDVVRSQMRSLKGTVAVSFSPGVGTTFTLRLPLTLTIAKLLVCFVGSTALALPSDSIEEIIVPKADQIQQSGTQRFLQWREQPIPAYSLADFLDYACPLPESSPSKALISVPSPKHWALPMLILQQNQQFFALEIDRLVTEQELVIKPFGAVIAPPSSTYGCTILGDGSLIPVIDAITLLEQFLRRTTKDKTTMEFSPQDELAKNDSLVSQTRVATKTVKAPTVLVVDDAVAMRRTLALLLERAGYRVLQAPDGREAIEQLQQSASVNLVICDIEMPNMNGFEFLSSRRQEPQLLEIPVVMLTSRSNDKHRWLAMQLGATAYFTKPYLEQEFLAAIKQILGQHLPENFPVLQPTL